VSRRREPQATPPPPGDARPPEREDLLRGVLLAWALLVTILFFLQPSTTDALVSFVFSLLGGGR
jgi:hypothetical protein